MKAIVMKNNQYVCNRCSNTNQQLFERTPCRVCGECVYCRNCIWLGKLTMCEELPIQNYTYAPYKNTFHIDYELSPLQKEASDYIISHLNNSLDTIIWAVCGARKNRNCF